MPTAYQPRASARPTMPRTDVAAVLYPGTWSSDCTPRVHTVSPEIMHAGGDDHAQDSEGQSRASVPRCLSLPKTLRGLVKRNECMDARPHVHDIV